MNGAVSRLGIGLVLLVPLGCGSEPEEIIDPSLASPEIRLTRPAPQFQSKPGGSIEFAGEIIAGPGAWKPRIVILRILGDEQGRREETSLAAELGKPGPSSNAYTFSGTLEAPTRTGRYFVQVMAMRDLRGQPGVDRVLTKPIPMAVAR